jgi:hypothetical protein
MKKQAGPQHSMRQEVLESRTACSNLLPLPVFWHPAATAASALQGIEHITHHVALDLFAVKGAWNGDGQCAPLEVSSTTIKNINDTLET